MQQLTVWYRRFAVRAGLRRQTDSLTGGTMRAFVRLSLVGVACVAVAAVVVISITQPNNRWMTRRARAASDEIPPETHLEMPLPPYPSPDVATYPDPNARPGSPGQVFIDPSVFDGGVFTATASIGHTAGDARSLSEYRETIGARAARAKSRLDERNARLRLDRIPTQTQVVKAMELYREFAFVALYEGDHRAAAEWLGKALALSRTTAVPAEMRAHITALLGINALRRGEQDNCIGCVGPSSCIFPISADAVHAQPSGSEEAVRWFAAYLDEWPGDLRIRWLLNIAAMTLGEYPDKVPPRYLIPVAPFRSNLDVGRFENVATRVGVISRGPDLAGGCIFDDFTGDGRPDVFTTTFDVNHGASLYVNRGDGTFVDSSEDAGLSDQIYALNVVRADYDNDSWPDLLLLRGAWEKPARMSLLRNTGGGKFEDVTVASGLAVPIATESAAWGDYDNDGRLDLFVCGEYLPPIDSPPGVADPREPDPRNRCRLYHNQGNGRFIDVASQADVLNERWAKAACWGDFDNDGWLDLFVSNMDGSPRLYHNMRNGNFEDVARSAGIVGPPHGFTSMFWDYDNDGWLDIFVADYSASLGEVVADRIGLPVHSENHAHLYRNLGPNGFREVSREVGLDRPVPAMSVNAGDIDNDGLLDLHIGTGSMNLSGLVPDLMFANRGDRFEDVTESTGTGHLQKGHGVSFADWDDDGDLDLFVVLGGGYPGDRGYNALFQNPGHKRHWLKVKLAGTKTNRSALGAKIHVELTGSDGKTRSIYRVIGNNGSFGGNSLVESIGLGDDRSVGKLTVTWPVSSTTQTFHDISADQEIEITEGTESVKFIHRKPITLAPATH
jgi:FG-GAP-like repeat/ASPIC and UnbV